MTCEIASRIPSRYRADEFINRLVSMDIDVTGDLTRNESDGKRHRCKDAARTDNGAPRPEAPSIRNSNVAGGITMARPEETEKFRNAVSVTYTRSPDAAKLSPRSRNWSPSLCHVHCNQCRNPPIRQIDSGRRNRNALWSRR